MSLIDDFMESSDLDPLHSLLPHFGDQFTSSNGHTNGDMMRLETGYVSTGFTVDVPIFVLDYVQFQFPASLMAIAVENNTLVIVLSTFHILRIDLTNPLEVEDIEITRKPSMANKVRLFFDPTGRHLILSTGLETYYLYSEWRQVKQLGTKLKDITAIAWNKQASLTESSTCEILMGTSTGTIYETVLEPSRDDGSSFFFSTSSISSNAVFEERYLKQVYSVPNNNITGLHFEQILATQRKYFVLVTTPSRMYEFVGSVAGPTSGFGEGQSNFEQVFAMYKDNPVFHELPGELPYHNNKVHFFSRFHELQQQGVAQTFALLTGAGISHGDLVFGSQNVGDNVLDNVQLLQYPSAHLGEDVGPLGLDLCISMALTEFHFILLYKDRVRAICRLNDKIVYEEKIPLTPGETVLGISIDNSMQTFWVYTCRSMYELVVKNEDRDVWRLYLAKKQYDMALRYCKDNDMAQKDQVYTAQAKDYFSQRRFQMSAKFFAESSTVPFEQVALLFIECDEMDALRVYLDTKLKRLQKKDQAQKTMLATWLVELYLSKMDDLDTLISSAHARPSNSPAIMGEEIHKDTTTIHHLEEQQEEIMDEFRMFLDSSRAYLHSPTTFRLFASHGRHNAWLFYASLIGDNNKVIDYWLKEKKWEKALDVLGKQTKVEPFYQFSPILMEHIPYETVTIWMRQQPHLNPRRLLPALLTYDSSKLSDKSLPNQAIRYLSFVVSTLGNTDPVIHNLLLTLYCLQPTKDETALLTFLKNEGQAMHYNVDYALRLCSQNGRMQSCVHLYSQIGLYEDAVYLALKNHDVVLACIHADKPEDDPVLRKKLWLTVAKQVVEGEKKDIYSALAFTRQCDLLKVDAILPFFMEFDTIGDFKDEVCTALEESTMAIEDLKMDMDEATKSAEHIRGDIKNLRSRFGLVNAVEKCYVCHNPLLAYPFYLFPCQHTFHAECMIQTITRFLPPRTLRRLAYLEEALDLPLTPSQTTPTTSNWVVAAAGAIFSGENTNATTEEDRTLKPTVLLKRQALQEELDDIVASECVLCGADTMLRSLDLPFVNEEEVGDAHEWMV